MKFHEELGKARREGEPFVLGQRMEDALRLVSEYLHEFKQGAEGSVPKRQDRARITKVVDGLLVELDKLEN